MIISTIIMIISTINMILLITIGLLPSAWR